METMETPAAVVETITAYIEVINARDAVGVRAQFHFPHVLFGRDEVQVYQTPDDYDFTDFDRHVSASNWGRSTFDGHRVVLAGPDKLHLDVWFTRYQANGAIIGTHHSLYILTLRNGRWGIQARSSYG